MPVSSNRRRFGDRRDGRRLRSLPSFAQLMPYITPRRGDALRYYSDSLEVSALEPWLRERRRQQWQGMGILHLFIAAWVRTVASCPGLNRFVSGQKLYARDTVDTVMMLQQGQAGEPEDVIAKTVFYPTDTVFDVYRKLGERVDSLKAGEPSDAARMAEGLQRIPGLLLKFVMWFLNLLDYFSLLPGRMLRASPFHGSMMITETGNPGTGPLFRHLYGFGALPAFVGIGPRRSTVEVQPDGTLAERSYVDYTVTLDGRLMDEAACADALRHLKYFLQNPKELEYPPERVAEDVM